MGLIDWLLGKRGTASLSAGVKQAATAAVGPERRQTSSEAENLRRWKESGKPRAWVEAHKGRWDHNDWLGLLEELKRSPYWPMQPDEVGMALEDARREWSRRN